MESEEEVLRVLEHYMPQAQIQIEERVMKVDENGKTILHEAVESGWDNVVRRLLENGKWKDLVNKRDKEGKTPLHICCEKDKFKREIAEILLTHGADVNAADQWGWAPLHVADQYEIVKLLLEKGRPRPNLDCKTSFRGATPLHMAASQGSLQIVNLLLDNGANVNLTTWNGETVLHWALRSAKEHEDKARQREQEREWERGRDEVDSNASDDEYGDGDETRQQDISDATSLYDPVIYRILRLLENQGKRRWTELLKVAYREEDENVIRYAAQKLYPGREKKWNGLHNIWLAMRKERFAKLEQILRDKVLSGTDDATKLACPSWNALDLAAHLNKREILEWLLRSHRWTKKQKDHAKGLLPEGPVPPLDNLRKNPIWNAPFLQQGRSNGQNYRYPEPRDGLEGFRTSIVDFYTYDKQLDIVCDSCEVFELLYDEELEGPQAHMNITTEQLSEDFVLLEPNTYNKDNLRLRWMHLPANCMEWMSDLTIVTYLEKQNTRNEYGNFLRFLQQSWHELPENGVKGKYMSPKCSKKSLILGESERSTKPESVLALYMPYITFGYLNTNSRDTNDRDDKLNEKYKASKPVIHKSRTLDGYFHGPAAETRNRDLEQVVTRWIQSNTNNERNSDILRVDQLWLWVIDDKTIISCGTNRADDEIDPIFEEISNRLLSLQEASNSEAMPSSVDSLVKFIVNFYVNVLDNLVLDIAKRAEPSQSAPTSERVSVYEMFADSIEKNNAEEKRLRDELKNLVGESSLRDRGSLKKITPQGVEALSHVVAKAQNIITDIKDIRDELNIIASVVQTQKVVLSQLLNPTNEDGQFMEASQDLKQMFSSRNTDPDYVLNRIKDLLRYAEETEKDTASILNLRMNQLGLHEAAESRRQGQTLMAFTIVTSIFLPLSFLSSLFALNVATFPHSGDNLLYQPGWIFGILFGTTVGFVILLVLGVTNLEEMANWGAVVWRKCTGWAKPRQGPRRNVPAIENGTVVGTQNLPTGVQGAPENNALLPAQRDHTLLVAGQGAGQDGNETVKKGWLGSLIQRLRGQNQLVNENPA
ncbi:hypothetical protein F5Y13DRAFT_202282 [Hypoxylon sp. FL1857]|nr:hypothetical protein F5Y13DRAFT_202282 [Hypoxylon sp. FL1857]